MKNTRFVKLVSLFVAIGMIISTMGIATIAVEEPTIVASDVTGSIGDTVDVTIALQDNPGFIAKAPANLVEQQKAGLAKALDKIKMINDSIAQIEEMK